MTPAAIVVMGMLFGVTGCDLTQRNKPATEICADRPLSKAKVPYKRTPEEAAAMVEVRHYLDAGGKVDAPIDDQTTRLEEAAEKGYRDLAEDLIRRGADVNRTDRFGKTPLNLAAYCGRIEVARVLLDNGANVNVVGEGGVTALVGAIEGCQEDMVELLLSRKAEVNIKQLSDYTPLHWAALEANCRIVRLLLDAGAHIDAETDPKESQGLDDSRHGFTPLLLAVVYDRMDIARLLVSKGAKYDIGVACSVGDMKFIRSHFNSGESVEFTRYKGWGLLHYAASCGQVEVAKFLIDHKCEIDARDYDGNTPLHLASYNNYGDMVSLLVDRGSAVNGLNKAGDTPLDTAAYTGAADSARALIRKKAAINHEAGDETPPPLAIAAENGYIEVVKALIDAGANVNARHGEALRNALSLKHRSMGDPPIRGKEDFEAVVKILLDHGADANGLKDEFRKFKEEAPERAKFIRAWESAQSKRR